MERRSLDDDECQPPFASELTPAQHGHEHEKENADTNEDAAVHVNESGKEKDDKSDYGNENTNKSDNANINTNADANENRKENDNDNENTNESDDTDANQYRKKSKIPHAMTHMLIHAGAPAVAVSMTGEVLLWNRHMASATQVPTAVALGMPLCGCLVDEDDIVDEIFQAARAAKHLATWTMECRLRGLHASDRDVVLTFSALTRTTETDMQQQKGGHVDEDDYVLVGIGREVLTNVSVVGTDQQQDLLESANASCFEVDAHGAVVFMNRKARDISEYAQVEVLGMDLVTQLVMPPCQESVLHVLQAALQRTETASYALVMRTKSGSRVELLMSAVPRVDTNGNVVGVICIGEDITDRLVLEREHRHLVEAANAPIFLLNTECQVISWNREATASTEYALEDVVGRDLIRFVYQNYRDKVATALADVKNGGEAVNLELPLVTKSGRRLDILLNASPRYDKRGRFIGIYGIGQDVTDRRAQELEYTRLIDTANAPIFGVDIEGRVNIWNRKAAQTTEFSMHDVLGVKLVEAFIPPDYQAQVGMVLSKAMHGTETANFEFPLVSRTGRRVEILLNATPRYDEKGDIIGVVGIGQDITVRIAQEQEYTRLIDSANAPIFGVNAEGRVNIWNRKAAEITEFTAAEVMGENLVEKFISQDYKLAVSRVLSKALSGVETANFEFPLITKSGRRVEILLNATSRFNEHGTVIGMVGIGQDITERIAQEQEYSRLIKKANAPIFGVDRSGCVTVWNQKIADITQYARADVIGEDLVATLIDEDYRDEVAAVLAKALDGNETSSYEVPLITKSGRKVNILLNATSRFNQWGQITGVVGIGQDLTDRIAQQEEYARLINTANAPIFGVDKDLCVTIWNKKAAQITQYTTSEVLGENLVETFISPEYRPIVGEVLTSALNGVQTANFEFPLITRSGARIEILLNATPRMDMKGNTVGVIGIGQDITDRIAQEHEYFRLIDTANAPIFGIDTFGCINEWNQKIEEITGHHKSSVLGLSLADTFIIAESRADVVKLLNQALVGIDVGEMELPMMTKTGESILLLVNASCKKDMHGNLRGVIGVGQDYTAKRRMEAARVAFLASFSHELRTPLNGVLGMLELLREQKLDKLPQRYAQMAYVSGSLLLNLINDILDLSKIEAGHLEISEDPFNVHELLDYVIEIFKFKAREKKVDLVLECANNVPKMAIGDVGRIRQVLLNLLSNAIKFTNEGSITVKCRAVPSPDLPKTRIKLLFQVIDTGVGMDDEERSRLFSLFTKLERTRRNNPTGSGLGLAICKQLVELMGGDIDIESELDHGSEFYFHVVVGRDDGGADELSNFPTVVPADLVLNPNTVTDLIPDQARILVVEDNEFNWEVVKCFFTEDDHFLQWEQNGKRAYDAYTTNHELYDLILMDCEMPVMNGYDATRGIREFESAHDLPRIPIIGLTAYAMSGDRKKCLDAGMDEFIVKPISKSVLRAAIRQWLLVRCIAQQPISRAPSVFSDDGDTVDMAGRALPLIAASTHRGELNMTRAISDLELEDPMMITRQPGYADLAADAALVMSTLSSTKSGHSLADALETSIMERSESTSDGTHEQSQSRDMRMSDGGQPFAITITPWENNSAYEEETKDADRHVDGLNDISYLRRRDGRYPVDNQRENDLSISNRHNPIEAEATLLLADIAAADGDPINYSLGVEQCGGSEALFLTLLEKFASVCDDNMRRIEAAFVSQDYDVLRRESHSLKGSSAYVAAMRVSNSACALQIAAERMLEIGASADSTALDGAFNTLKKENRLMLGYLRRNFSFRRRSDELKYDVKRNDDQSGCAMM